MYHFYYCSVGLLTVAGPIASLDSITNFVRNGYIYLYRKFIHCSQNIPLDPIELHAHAFNGTEAYIIA